jgi:spore maturation protein CgeB
LFNLLAFKYDKIKKIKLQNIKSFETELVANLTGIPFQIVTVVDIYLNLYVF